MKKAIYFVIFGALLTLTACDPNKDSSTNDGQIYAQTPVPCNIPGQSNCNPSIYQQNNWIVASYQYSYANGFCGCPAGTRPVMSPQYGIGCAPTGVFQQQYQYAGWGQPSNNHWTSIPQVTYTPAVSGSTGNCYAEAGRSCSVRAANSCGAGKTCRPVGGASDLGLCTSGYGQETYEHPRNCGYTRDNWGQWQYICSNYGNGYNPGYPPGNGGLPR